MFIFKRIYTLYLLRPNIKTISIHPSPPYPPLLLGFWQLLCTSPWFWSMQVFSWVWRTFTNTMFKLETFASFSAFTIARVTIDINTEENFILQEKILQFIFVSPAKHKRHIEITLSGVCPSVCLFGSQTFLVVTHSYVSQATHAFLGMLPLCCLKSN